MLFLYFVVPCGKFRSSYFVVPCGKFRSSYLDMATAAATIELSIRFKMSVALSCVQTMISLPVFGIFNVYTDVDACDVVDDGGFRKDGVSSLYYTPVGGCVYSHQITQILYSPSFTTRRVSRKAVSV